MGQKNLGRKFVLTKFYFGLIRFFCVVLLLTADLNNNNTEFVWWWVGGWWVPTHNVVKPTSTWHASTPESIGLDWVLHSYDCLLSGVYVYCIDSVLVLLLL